MIKYVSLLRGINISGKNKISMTELKKYYLQCGYENVFTCLNSGNVIFTSDIEDKDVIRDDIHSIIEKNFNLDISVFIISAKELEEIVSNTPIWWGTDNKLIYDNIIFLIPPIKYNEAYAILGEPKKEYEQISEYMNCIFWSYDLENYRKTNWWSKTANTIISDKITIRTANTIRKILEICNR